MKVQIFANDQQVAQQALSMLNEVVENNPTAVIGLATGSTPLQLYKLMIEHKDKYRQVTTVNLDEYVGLGEDDVNSYHYYMHSNLFRHIGIDKDKTHLPQGVGGSLAKLCQDYNRLLSNNRQDVQILGIGSNGHIAFNEPYTPFDSVTHVVDLTPSTIADNSRLFDRIEDVPTQAITMGISNIMASKSIIVIATGKAKAQAVYDMICGQVDERCPASILQRHNNCTVLLDQDAGSLLPAHLDNVKYIA